PLRREIERRVRALNPHADMENVDWESHLDASLTADENIERLADIYPELMWVRPEAPERFACLETREMPLIGDVLIRRGLEPKKRCALQKRFTIAGLDTEGVGSRILSVQINYVDAKGREIRIYKTVRDGLTQGYHNLKLFPDRAYVSAHNLEYDLGNLLGQDWLKAQQGIGGMTAATGVTSWAVAGKRIFVDSANFFGRKKLATLAETMLGMKKLDPPEWIGRREPETDKEWEELRLYGERDAEIQRKITEKIIELHRIDNIALSLTPANLAGKVFRKNYLKKPLKLPDRNVMSKAWSCYYGARTEAFGRGTFHGVRCYDINSLYPYACMEQPLPFSNPTYREMNANDIMAGMEGWVLVRFKYPETETYPALPVRKGKLYFPLEGETWVATPELRPEMSRLEELEILDGTGWMPKAEDIEHPLKAYMRDNYAKRLVSTELKTYYKMLMNSLIGKFASRTRPWNPFKAELPIASHFFNPAVCSLILSKARAVLAPYLRKYGALYCDTDSIFTTGEMPVSNELGGMKLEGDGTLLVVRSKLYFLYKEGKVVKAATHGIRKIEESGAATRDQDIFEQLNQLPANGRTVTYSRRRMIKSKEAYRRKLLPRTFLTQSFAVTLEEDGKREYDAPLSTIAELRNGRVTSSPLRTAP
ncbi:MAG: DNA polymerase, partial [Candidatus Aenigmatarchaeota archaeon]